MLPELTHFNLVDLARYESTAHVQVAIACNINLHGAERQAEVR